MNIFILSKNIKKCAQYHCDKHVVKMILESAQILCTVCNENGSYTPYKSTHLKHPCTIWAGESLSNWKWLKQLSVFLNDEYKYRYNKKDHKSFLIINNLPLPNIKDIGLTKFAQAMPDIYKNREDVVKAYRDYYFNEKKKFCSWKKRETPYWFKLDRSGY